MSRISVPKPLPVDVAQLSAVEHNNQTILLHTLSSLFPEGEAFFVKSVRHYRNRIERGSPLDVDVGRFIGQEAHHSRAHSKINSVLYDNGIWNPEKVEKAALSSLFRLSPRLSLHVTAVLEHWTATLAKQLLANTYPMTDAEKALWWEHAKEEIEHAHVSYELLLKTGNALTPLWGKLLFPLVSGLFILTLACMYVKNGGGLDFKLLWKLSQNTELLLDYCLPGYIP